MGQLSDAALPVLITRAPAPAWLASVGVVLTGVVSLGLLAHLSIHLPWTPVPITGQTFGVSLVALLYGRRLGVATMAAYLAAGVAGLPVFAAGQGIALAPTSGYLFGMLIAAALIGTLSDIGFSRTWLRSLAACLAGSVCIFGFGLMVLSTFMGSHNLLAAGLLPFIPGDLIKSLLASGISTAVRNRATGKSLRK